MKQGAKRRKGITHDELLSVCEKKLIYDECVANYGLVGNCYFRGCVYSQRII